MNVDLARMLDEEYSRQKSNQTYGE